MDEQPDYPSTVVHPVDSVRGIDADEPPEVPPKEGLYNSRRLSNDDFSSYDLRPPPPTVSQSNAELLADRLFSTAHLNIILKDATLFQKFTNFLNKYRPHSAPVLVRYLESQKALAAIRYANALAEQIAPSSRQNSWGEAVGVDLKLESFARRAMDELVSDALPAYVTYRMVNFATECLVKEITGSNTPVMRDLVQGIAEVYCLTDPSVPDNPIVFASEEFYNTTQYGREYVIGKNCRFLQGPKTQQAAVKRISHALRNGQEVCEILLNYRRDGSPFLNLVMMAPLMDARGKVRYFIGCQIDISKLIEGGQGLESFHTLLEREKERPETPIKDSLDSRPPLKVLRELGGLLNDEEIEIVAHRDNRRRRSIDSAISTPARSICEPKAAAREPKPARRFVGMEEPEPNFWPSSHFGSSGRLPGVYQNYLLVRPYPSLRIIFTSAALRIPGLSQSKLMDRIGGPQHVRDGLIDAFAQGIGVTAKISWLTNTAPRSHSLDVPDPFASVDTVSEAEIVEGKPRWIHCTPLQGSDGKPGVIMVVMVDRDDINGTTRVPVRTPSRPALVGNDYTKEGWPLRGMGVGAAHARFTPSKLYADYLRREGRTTSTGVTPVGMTPVGTTPGAATPNGAHGTNGFSGHGRKSVKTPSVTSDDTTGGGGVLTGAFGGSGSGRASECSTPHRRSASVMRWINSSKAYNDESGMPM
ncbi:hypothetical protein BS50DRAFT_582591 [Corynespora cassiicola Philippines]|uniref:PAC domain-containing protein n=1 Tax=Corynespora cassiicola Philippines TaxID=1448308 RepID=A0A2T2P5N9_CORCC|nr:hypothetical protein BS50DRAFT_582591 [Corynespora cassiicola Philippines]